MELILGGAYQGKLTWAAERHSFSPEDLWDLALADPVPGKRCYYHLEALTRRDPEPERFLPILEQADAVISREIGAGVVPMDPEDRLWRERHGVMLRLLAGRAAGVHRILCGLDEVLK